MGGGGLISVRAHNQNFMVSHESCIFSVHIRYSMPQKYADKNNFLHKQITDHNEKVWLNTF